MDSANAIPRMETEGDEGGSETSFHKLVALANAALASCNQDVPMARKRMYEDLTGSERDEVLWIGVCRLVAHAAITEGRTLPIHSTQEMELLHTPQFVMDSIDKRAEVRPIDKDRKTIPFADRLLKRIALKASVFHIGQRKLIDMRYEELRQFCELRQSSMETESATLSYCRAVLAGMRPETAVNECWTAEQLGALGVKYKVFRPLRSERSDGGGDPGERSRDANQGLISEVGIKAGRGARSSVSKSKRSQVAR